MIPFSRTDATSSSIFASLKTLRGWPACGLRSLMGQRKYFLSLTCAAEPRRAPMPRPSAGLFAISASQSDNFARQVKIGDSAFGTYIVEQDRQPVAGGFRKSNVAW